MKKILLALICFFLGILTTNALYKHQVGQYDWDYRTIGDVDRIRFLKHHAAFVTKDGFIGTFSANDGKVDWSKDLSQTKTLVEFGPNGFFVLDKDTKTFYTFDYPTGIKSSYVHLELPQEEIIDAFIETSESQKVVYMGVLTKKNIYFYDDKVLKLKQPVSAPLSHLRYHKDTIYAVATNQKEGTCIYSYNPLSPTQDVKKCFEAGEKDAKVQVSRDQVVIRGIKELRVVALAAEVKSAVFSRAPQTRNVYLDKCRALVVQKDTEVKINLFDIRTGTFNQAATVLASPGATFSCNQETSYLYVTEVTGSSTIKKIRRINLSVSNEAPKLLMERVADFSLGRIEDVYPDKILDDFRIILKTENLEIIMVNRDNKIGWKREDSLSEIKEIQFFDYESLEQKEYNPYFEHLDEYSDRLIDIPTNFIRRLQAQSTKLIHGINYLIKSATELGLKKLWESDSKFDKHGGLQKIIIAITKRNTILGIDSKTGTIFWEKNIDRPWSVERIFKSKRTNLVKEALVYLKDTSSKTCRLVHIDPLDGTVTGEESFEKAPQELIQLHLTRATAFVMVFDDNTVDVYPKGVERKEVSELIKDMTIYRIDKKDIIGYQLFDKNLVPTWNLQLPAKEEIYRASHWSYDVEETAFETIIPEDRKVIYKFSDSNNFALLTRSTLDKPHLNLYIINGATGRILSSRAQFDVDFSQPINLLYDENGVFVTYFNTKNLQYEIWVTELYKSELESSFTSLLERYFFEKLQTDEEEKYNNANPGFVVFTQKYYFGPGIKSIGAVETIHGVTKKNLIIVTSNDQIYSMDRGLLSTRRQITMDGKVPESDPTSFGSSELPPYAPMLPVSNFKYLTYYKKFSGLNHVESTPTRFESTSLTLIYGHDVVYVRVAPEKEFDMLSEDFKYAQLLGSIALISVGLIVIMRLTKKQRILRVFLG